jgi:hypothetical protein
VLAAAEHAKKATDEKLTALAELQREHAEVQQYKSNLTWGLRYLEEKKTELCDQLADFGKKVESAVEVQEEKLRRLSIEYDEELYPHLMSMIAERRYLSYIILYFYLYIYIFSLMHLLFVQVVDQPWLALGCHGHVGVPRGRGCLW